VTTFIGSTPFKENYGYRTRSVHGKHSLIQMISGLKPFKIIGIIPLYVILFRTVRSYKKTICRILRLFNFREENFSSRVKSTRTFCYDRHNQNSSPPFVSSYYSDPGNLMRGERLCPNTRESLSTNGCQRASENSAEFQKHPLDSLPSFRIWNIQRHRPSLVKLCIVLSG
jgi:hypothetical protein